MIRSLVLFWGFPNQLSSDSWAVRLCGGRPCSALDCETTNGSGSKIFCPGEKVMWAAMQQTTGCSLMRFFTDIERESRGRIKDLLPGREGHVGGNAADNRLFVDA